MPLRISSTKCFSNLSFHHQSSNVLCLVGAACTNQSLLSPGCHGHQLHKTASRVRAKESPRRTTTIRTGPGGHNIEAESITQSSINPPRVPYLASHIVQRCISRRCNRRKTLERRVRGLFLIFHREPRQPATARPSG